MGAIPDSIETDRQPPLEIPLRHFVVGLGLLAAAALLWTLTEAGVAPGMSILAATHLLLVGWVCVTIMGAMTQFVPVWSGVTLHSDRLATIQLWLVVAGLAGFGGLLLFGPLSVLPVPGALMLAGFWVFVYNLARTLYEAGRPDVTEEHFAVALGWFVVVTMLGLTLAVTYAAPAVVAGLPIPRQNILLAHATAAVFGVVFTTVVGALYQLVQMFTQSDFSPVDRHLQRVETVVYPVGVLALVVGRLVGAHTLATVGGILLLSGLTAVALAVGHRLLDNQVQWTPMLTRYAVAIVAMAAWIAMTLPAWLADPLAYGSMLGPAGARTLLLFGVVLFVVAGTLYHVVPFIVWFHRYSDRLGLEAVPMLDDLYDDRLAVVDFSCLGAGAVLLTLSAAGLVPTLASFAGSSLLTLGVLVFGVNMLRAIRGHSPFSPVELLFRPRQSPTSDSGE